MEGAHSGPSRGIIPRAIEDVFMYIENDRNAAQSKFLVRASYLQIYNEVRASMPSCTFSQLCSMLFPGNNTHNNHNNCNENNNNSSNNKSHFCWPM